MPLVEPDYSESFKPIAPGVYTCKVISCEFKTSQNMNRYLNWKLETVPEKQTVYHSTPIEGRGAGIFKKFVKCVDPSYEEGRYNTDDLIGKLVIMHLDIKQVESKGKTISVFNVKDVEAAPSSFGSEPNFTEDDISF